MPTGYTQSGVDALLAQKAPTASPTLTGVPAAPTAAATTNSTQIATTAFVKAQGYAPAANPTFTGIITGITKATVGLSNVDNTSDAVKFAAYGIYPVIHYDGTAWPARTVPTGYTGPVVWESEIYVNALEPTGVLDGDRWSRQRIIG